MNDADKPPANGLKRLEEKLSLAASPGTFPKYVRANFERLARIIEGAGRRGDKWELIAQWAVEEGLTGGAPLKAAAAKRAFDRETRRRKDQTEAKRPAKTSSPPLPPSKPSPPTSTPDDDADFEFRTLRRPPKRG